MKNRPPMRKWVIGLLFFYFLCIMRIYGTPKELTNIEWIQYLLSLFREVISKTINNDLAFAYFSFALLVIILIGCIVNRSFRQAILEKLWEVKKEITGEIYNQEWADKLNLVKEQIFICEEFDEYSDLIHNLCGKACIREVNFIIDDSNENIIEAEEKNGQPPVIKVNSVLLSKLEIIKPVSVRPKILKFIIAHELVHVKYHDSMNKEWIWRFYSLLWLGGLALLWNYFIASIGHGVIIRTILVVLLLFWCIFVSVVINLTYWHQMTEFRADRLALKMSEESPKVFEIYAKYFPDGVFGRKNFSERMRYYFKILMCFFIFRTTQTDFMGHPSNLKRKEALNSGRPWSVFEYFRYAYLMKKSSLMGLGKKV